ncbi:MAG: FAD-dependent oxidoreductase [Tepidisphaeraceae bacterium]
MSEQQFDVIVIGAGPGGYVAAIRAAQLGLKTACVEKEFLGGTCLNIGCIPSKALLDSSERYAELKKGLDKHGIGVGSVTLDLPKMLERKNGVVKALTGGVGLLFKKNKVEHLKGAGSITAPGTVTVTDADGKATSYTTKNIVIATGSVPSQVPALPFDGKNIISSTEALSMSELPQKLLIVGGGYIGVEMASVWSRLGSEVTVVEFLDGILPASDRDMAAALQRSLEKQGIKFKFNTAAQGVKIEGGQIKLAWKSKDGATSGEEVADKVLVCVGRRPITDGLGLDKAGVKVDQRGFVLADGHFRTNVPGVYAIGDVIGGIMLAHKAEKKASPSPRSSPASRAT